jgi:hypothetical protein
MSSKIEVANKNLSEGLTRQFREESESLKKEITNKLKSDIFNLTEAMDQLRKIQTLMLLALGDYVNTVHERLDDKMNENMSVDQRQTEEFFSESESENRSLKREVSYRTSQ